MPHITISYRRADSDAMAGRIRDKLADYYGAESIFMDIDSIPVGIDFRQQIKNELSKNDMLLVVVGPKWRGPGKGGRARINDENDPVRVEVEAALQRGIPVVPVLVNGATIPKPDELPESLRNFSFHNGAIVDAGQDFHQHMDRLMRSLDKVLGMKAPAVGGNPVAKAHWGKWIAVGASVVAAALAGAAGTWFVQNQMRPASPVVTAQPQQKPTTIGPSAVAPNLAVGTLPVTGTAPVAAANTASPAANSAAPTASQPLAAKQSAASAAPATTQPIAANQQIAAVPPAADLAAAMPVAAGCKGSAAFEDGFKPPEVGWYRGLGVRDTGSNAYFADGRLVMKPATKRSRIIVYPSLIFKTATICATIQSPAEIKGGADTSAGVAFWAADDKNLYSVELYPDGSYNIYRLIDNTWSRITTKTKSEAIKQGPDELNEVEIRIKEASAEIFINGTKVQDFKGQPPTRMSSVGFMVRNESEQDYEWRFHNIRVLETR